MCFFIILLPWCSGLQLFLWNKKRDANILIITVEWICLLYEVSFIFLSGKKTSRHYLRFKTMEFLSQSSFFIILEEQIVDNFKQIYFGMMNYDKEFLKTVKQTNNVLGTLWFIGGTITNLQKSRCKDGNTKLGWKFFLKPKSNNTDRTVTE